MVLRWEVSAVQQQQLHADVAVADVRSLATDERGVLQEELRQNLHVLQRGQPQGIKCPPPPPEPVQKKPLARNDGTFFLSNECGFVQGVRPLRAIPDSPSLQTQGGLGHPEPKKILWRFARGKIQFWGHFFWPIFFSSKRRARTHKREFWALLYPKKLTSPLPREAIATWEFVSGICPRNCQLAMGGPPHDGAVASGVSVNVEKCHLWDW